MIDSSGIFFSLKNNRELVIIHDFVFEKTGSIDNVTFSNSSSKRGIILESSQPGGIVNT